MNSVYRCLVSIYLLLLALHLQHALELMEEPAGLEGLDEESAELPASLHSYNRDTVAHFNPKKQDGSFRQMWERVPPQKIDIIK